MRPVFYKELDSATQAQIGQLHAAKRLPRGERHRSEVITYTRTTISVEEQTVTHRIHNHETKPIQPTRPNEKSLKELFRDCLKDWNMTLTAPLLNGVFFKDRRQAYNALRKMEELGFYVRKDGAFTKA